MRRFLLNFVIGVVALGIGAAAAAIPLFTGPTGSNPIQFPPPIYDFNALINTINSASFSNSAVSMPNILQNSDFAVDRRNEGAAVTLTSGVFPVMTVDRWQGFFQASVSGAGNPTVQRAVASTGNAISPYELKVTSSTQAATSVPAGLELIVQQQIEGQDMADMLWGTSGADPATYSLWAKASVAGVYSVFVQNAAQTRSYVTDCTLPAAVWTRCSAVIPGDGLGSWNTSRGTVGAIMGMTGACGASYQTTAGAWTTGNYVCDANATQMVSTVAATLEVSAPKLERGVFATSWNAPPASDADIKLTRFYRKTFPTGTAPAANAGLAGAYCVVSAAAQPVSAQFQLVPEMFSAPNVNTYNPSNTNSYWRDVTGFADLASSVDPSSAKGSTGVEIVSALASAANHNLCIHATFDTQK